MVHVDIKKLGWIPRTAAEILPHEAQAIAAFAAHGVKIKRVMTDNGSCYRSRAFAAALGPHVKHRRTRPYRPQANGKVCEDLSWCCVGSSLTPAKV
jgi:transposase InsO family protein